MRCRVLVEEDGTLIASQDIALHLQSVERLDDSGVLLQYFLGLRT